MRSFGSCSVPPGCPLGALDLIEDHQPIEMSAQEARGIAQLSLVLRRFQIQLKGVTILGNGLCKRRSFNLPGPEKGDRRGSDEGALQGLGALSTNHTLHFWR